MSDKFWELEETVDAAIRKFGAAAEVELELLRIELLAHKIVNTYFSMMLNPKFRSPNFTFAGCQYIEDFAKACVAPMDIDGQDSERWQALKRIIIIVWNEMVERSSIAGFETLRDEQRCLVWTVLKQHPEKNSEGVL